jgi:hypothetical protein
MGGPSCSHEKPSPADLESTLALVQLAKAGDAGREPRRLGLPELRSDGFSRRPTTVRSVERLDPLASGRAGRTRSAGWNGMPTRTAGGSHRQTRSFLSAAAPGLPLPGLAVLGMRRRNHPHLARQAGRGAGAPDDDAVCAAASVTAARSASQALDERARGLVV